MENKYIKIENLKKVCGIGEKTLERIEETLLNNEDDNTYISKYNPSLHLDINNIYNGDCLNLMNGIPDKSIDMILCDLPYGTTACKWDSVIPFDKLWKQYERIITDNGTIVLFGSQPFTTKLINSNLDIYKYNLVWEKEQGTDFMMSKKKPLKNFEDICIFYKKQPTYNPQMISVNKTWYKKDTGKTFNHILGQQEKECVKKSNGKYRYPTSILKFNRPKPKGIHPTQKPLKLFEWLIKTYTNENMLVLDNCIGSGTTAIACLNTNRKYIGIEKEEKYCNIAKDRINNYLKEIHIKK